MRNITNTLLAVGKYCLLLAVACLLSSDAVQTTPSRAYRVKATFLYNFTKFIDWPATAFDDKQSPFIIAIVGEDPFGAFLDKTVEGESVKGHPIVIRRYATIAELEHCQVLYVTPNAIADFRDNKGNLRQNLLTVSDSPDFNETGGMIRLSTKENKIKLIINPEAVKIAELSISSKLLNVAEIFNGSS